MDILNVKPTRRDRMTFHISQPHSPQTHWQSFFEAGYIEVPVIRDVIIRSWQRCIQSNVDSHNTNLHDHLRGNDLATAIVQRARP